MTDPLREAIRETVEARKEAVNFFSNNSKQEREKWVVGQFLRKMGIEFVENELMPATGLAPDIIFRDAAFEIKEIDVEGRRRHDEKKEELKKAQAASSLDDLLSSYEFKEISFQGVVDRVDKALKRYVCSPDFSKKTNILFYVNYTVLGEHCFTSQNFEIWKQWRSLSMVSNNNVFYVFWAAVDAPSFLKMGVVK